MSTQSKSIPIVEIVHFSKQGEPPKVFRVERAADGGIFMSMNEGKAETYKRVNFKVSEQELALIVLKLFGQIAKDR